MKKSRYRSPYQSYAIVGVIVVGAVMVALLMSGNMLSLATWWICSSIATWLMYTFDKMQAKRKGAGSCARTGAARHGAHWRLGRWPLRPLVPPA